MRYLHIVDYGNNPLSDFQFTSLLCRQSSINHPSTPNSHFHLCCRHFVIKLKLIQSHHSLSAIQLESKLFSCYMCFVFEKLTQHNLNKTTVNSSCIYNLLVFLFQYFSVMMKHQKFIDYQEIFPSVLALKVSV